VIRLTPDSPFRGISLWRRVPIAEWILTPGQKEKHVISKFKQRLAAERGFTLIELLVVIVILGILVAIAVPSYLSFRGKAQTAAAQANVRSAIPSAESFYQTNNTYTGLNHAALQTSAPGVGANVKGVAVNSGKGYCIDDSEDAGATTYDYVGGDPTGALQAGYKAATIQLGTCLLAVGAASA
jgi:prepilin-type N-terminal cleavage/methylation domain-containing protein